MTGVPFVVSEIMYHASPPTAVESGAGFTESDFDFIELRNVGPDVLSLAGFSFSSGIDFTFGALSIAPGDYTVVAANSAAFHSRYSASLSVAGVFGGSLGNNGEALKLVDAAGATVFDFTYDDWYSATDGAGYSMVIVDPLGPASQWNQVSGWKVSAAVQGSPGRNEVVVDPSAPTTPADLTAATVDNARVDLAWQAASDPESGVAAYRVYRNGLLIASTSDTQFSDETALANATYAYTVRAVNASLVASDTSPTATASLPPVGETPTFASAQVAGIVAIDTKETSGIVASRHNADVFWIHNDGAAKKLVAINAQGAALGTLTLSGINSIDTEDLAIGPGPVAAADYLYFGDIGDNDAIRTSVTIYRVAEPTIDANAVGDQSTTAPSSAIETITLRYPTGAVDAETLLVDPLTGDLYILAKDSGSSRIFRAPAASIVGGANILMQLAGNVAFSIPSGGDISVTGHEILLRNENEARLYSRAIGQSIADALAHAPIIVPVVGTPTEPNGEAITFDGQGNHYYTVSEGRNPALYYFHRTSRSPSDPPAMLGDFNGDGSVDLRDLIILQSNFDTPSGATAAMGDIDANGTVDRADVAQFARQFGKTQAASSASSPASPWSAPPHAASSIVARRVDRPSVTARRAATSSPSTRLNSVAVDDALTSGTSIRVARRRSRS